VDGTCHLHDVERNGAPEKESVSNVHGVRSDFLLEGERRAKNNTDWSSSAAQVDHLPQTYFIGKLLWAKGLDNMLELQDYYKQCTGDYFEIDVFGSGPDRYNIMRAFYGRNKNSTNANATEISSTNATELSYQEWPQALRKRWEEERPKSFAELLRRKPIPANFPGRVDHGTLTDYKVFVNPSVSEVLCTTTAEALAMGKVRVYTACAEEGFECCAFVPYSHYCLLW
jgi:digalactosyldiacylglycerol synthase